MTIKRNYAQFGRAIFATAALSALLCLVSVPKVHADDGRAKCQHNIEKAEANLDRAVQRHGEHSHEADRRRNELNAERQHCWDKYHGYWNGHDHQWHDQHDWDIVIHP